MSGYPFQVALEQNSYDQVAYEGWSYAQTHPDVLATVAILRGMKPAPVETCRVLEVGCAEGYNLMPMAVSLPDAEFVGIDYSPRQIEAAESLRASLSIPNVRFYAMDITAWDETLGTFDYIIAHGLYSWVAAPVRAALLDLCRRALAPHGVAYISYNTYPGWHMLAGVRDMMLYHTAAETDPTVKIQKAAALITLIAEATHRKQPLPYSSFHHIYADLIRTYQQDHSIGTDRHYSLLLHDELSEINDPFYFHEFVGAIEKHGLRYVGDAEFNSMLSTNIPAETAAQLQTFARSSVDAEQYMDFVRNRGFRRSLICHADVPLGSSVSATAMQTLYFSAHASPEVVEENHNHLVKFISVDAASLSTDHPVSIAALDGMNKTWPQRYRLDDLLNLAYDALTQTNPSAPEWQAARTGQNSARRAQDGQILASNLLRAFCISAELVDFHTHRGSFTTVISHQPTASPWARWQAPLRTRVADLRLKRVEIDSLGQFLLPLLDGTRSFENLVDAILDGPVASGAWRIEGEEEINPETLPALLHRSVKDALQWFATAALLQG